MGVNQPLGRSATCAFIWFSFKKMILQASGTCWKEKTGTSCTKRINYQRKTIHPHPNGFQDLHMCTCICGFWWIHLDESICTWIIMNPSSKTIHPHLWVLMMRWRIRGILLPFCGARLLKRFRCWRRFGDIILLRNKQLVQPRVGGNGHQFTGPKNLRLSGNRSSQKHGQQKDQYILKATPRNHIYIYI